MKIDSLQEAEATLRTFVPEKVKRVYKLQSMFNLMERVGNPQDRVRVIHVAGTAGKTSTSYYIAKMLQLSGESIGLTVSPHISTINERVQINGQPLPETEFCRLLTEFLAIKGVVDARPTYFELLIAFAYWVFDKKQVDYAVVEVGLGGLLDGTNVATRADKVCVITDIGLDHVKILGNTLEEIALQKAGIIHRGNTVFMLHQPDVVEAVIYDYAKQQQAQLFIHEQSSQVPPSLPSFQKRNWALAHDVYEYMATRDGLSAINLESESSWPVPGRMEVIQNFILDGAHNPVKFEALVKTLRQQFPGQKLHFILAMKDAHLQEDMRLIAPLAKKVICTPVKATQDFHELPARAETARQTAQAAGIKNVQIVRDIKAAIQAVPQGETTVITGSLFLLGPAKEVLLKV